MEVRIRGLQELNRVLQQLPAEIEAKMLRASMREGAKVIAEQAKATVRANSYDTGALHDSIRVASRMRAGRITVAVVAGGRIGKKKVKQSKSGRYYAGYDSVIYARWIEYGTGAHTVMARDGGFLNFGDVFTKSAQHPGIKAEPFMRPALESKAQEALMAIAMHLRSRLSAKFGKSVLAIQPEVVA